MTVTDPWAETQSTPTHTVTADMDRIKEDLQPVVGRMQLTHWEERGYSNHLGSAAGRAYPDGVWAGIRLVLNAQHAIGCGAVPVVTEPFDEPETETGECPTCGPDQVATLTGNCSFCGRPLNLNPDPREDPDWWASLNTAGQFVALALITGVFFLLIAAGRGHFDGTAALAVTLITLAATTTLWTATNRKRTHP